MTIRRDSPLPAARPESWSKCMAQAKPVIPLTMQSWRLLEAKLADLKWRSENGVGYAAREAHDLCKQFGLQSEDWIVDALALGPRKGKKGRGNSADLSGLHTVFKRWSVAKVWVEADIRAQAEQWFLKFYFWGMSHQQKLDMWKQLPPEQQERAGRAFSRMKPKLTVHKFSEGKLVGTFEFEPGSDGPFEAAAKDLEGMPEGGSWRRIKDDYNKIEAALALGDGSADKYFAAGDTRRPARTTSPTCQGTIETKK